MDLYNKDPKSGPQNLSDTLSLLLIVGLAMSLYAFLMLSSGSAVFKGVIVGFILISIVRIYFEAKGKWAVWEAGFEIAFFVVFLSVILGVYGQSLISHPILLYSTIFYRPEYTKAGDRRLAFILSLLILVTVVPATWGFITDSALVQISFVVYALLVLLLWVFCTKIGTRVLAYMR